MTYSMHTENMMKNIEIYQKAQEKLKTIVKKVALEGGKTQYCSIVKISDDFFLWANLYRCKNDLLYISLYRNDKDDKKPKRVARRIKYEDFIRAFPEFGRRDIWRVGWNEAGKRYTELEEKRSIET